MKIPFVTKEQIVQLDDLMIHEFNIPVSKMMEYAGYNTAMLARKLAKGKNMLVLCGKGNNCGDGLCAARHLHNWGYNVSVFLISINLKNEPLVQLDILKRLGIELFDDLRKLKSKLKKTNLVIDALIGYNLKGNPREIFARAINITNKSSKPVLSIDVPSGFDIATKKAMNPCIKATDTISLSLPKQGMLNSHFVGHLYIAEISVPPELYEKMGLKVPNLFEKESVVKIA